MDTKKIFLIGTSIIVALLLFSGQLFANNNQSSNITITDHDNVWDYKREKGVWWTRRKTNPQGVWLNMKTSLTPENYNLAISRLTAYLTTKQL